MKYNGMYVDRLISVKGIELDKRKSDQTVCLVWSF